MSLVNKLAVTAGSLLAATNLASAQTNDLVTNWIYNPETKHEYALTIPGEWLAMRSVATANGGDLVSINDEAEKNWLLSNFQSTPVDTFAIGMIHNNGTNGWINGESVEYQNWYTGEPTSNGIYVRMFNSTNFWHVPGGFWEVYSGQSGTPIAGIVERVPPFRPAIKDIKKIDSNIYLSVETQPSRPFTLQSSTNLTSWEVVFTFPGTANTNITKIYLPEQKEEQKFYRITK